MNDTPRLIVADGDDRLRDDLTGQLLADGFAAELRCRAARGADLLILGELDEPTTALAVLRELRSGDALGSGIDPWLPVLVLSGAAGEWVPLRCFEAGCDDFQRKPVSYLELRARVRAIVRRTGPATGKRPRRVGALAIDPSALEAHYAGTRLELSRLEFALLCQLASDPLRVFTKRELLRDVWGYRADGATRTLDAHACRLRRKLQHVGAARHVVNRRGVGYRLVDRVPQLLAESSPGGGRASGEGPVVALRRASDAS